LIAELQEDVLVAVVFQIETYAALVAIDRCEGRAKVRTGNTVLIRRGMVWEKRRNVAVAVTRWRFDLDDPRPEVGEETRSKRASKCPCAVDDGQIVEGPLRVALIMGARPMVALQ
jgi:hypothetical protein